MRGHITKKGNNYYIVVDIGRDINGKRKQKWFGGYKTKKEAEKELAKKISEIESNNFIDTNNMTLKDYLLKWLETYVDVNLQQSTIYGYRINIEQHIIPSIGNILLQKLQPFHIQNFYDEKLKNGRLDGKGGLSAKSVIYIHRTLKKALQQAVKLQLINKNVADFVEPPKKKKFKAEFLKDEEIPLFIEAFKETDIFIPVMLALGLGLRRGEALGLRWQDIDFKNKIIAINQTILHSKRGFFINTPKTEKSNRTILISDLFINLFKEQKLKQDKLKELLGQAYKDNDLVTCLDDGTPINPSSFSQKFRRILKQNNLRLIRFHDLRHTNATLMLKSNIPAKIASERLGHSTTGITLDLYSHVVNEMQEEAVDKLDEVIFK